MDDQRGGADKAFSRRPGVLAVDRRFVPGEAYGLLGQRSGQDHDPSHDLGLLEPTSGYAEVGVSTSESPDEVKSRIGMVSTRPDSQWLTPRELCCFCRRLWAG
jgi:ABC-type multidrug transport system ATPase subunit